MSRKYGFVLAGLIFLFIFNSVSVFGDGIIIPEPPINRPRPRDIKYLDIVYHKVNIEIDNQVAVTHVDQEFHNPFNYEIEGTYIFPIPEDAAISEFSMWVGKEKITGEVLEANKAREIYEKIVREMRDPGLLEYMGRNMFKARVYPIEANGDKRVELEYEEVLNYDFGLVKYEYPLDTERFSNSPLETVVVTATVKSKKPIINVYSPSHKIDIKRVDDYTVKVSYEDSDTLPDKNFVLYYSVSDKEFGVNTITHKGYNQDGYFMMMVAPGKIKESQKINPKNITFILDTSGSMAGKKIKQAKNALKFCLNSLNKEDKFNIINFSSTVYYFQENLISVNEESINESLEFVEDLQARGGTDINNALLKGLGNFSKNSDRPNYIVFLTDGEPTVGITENSEIIKNITKANKNDVRLFVFGVGYNVNTILLDKLGRENHGVSDYINPEEDIEVKISNFYAKISDPILSDLKLKVKGVKIYDIFPEKLPDLFAGSQLLIAGRYKNSGNTTIILSGKRSGREVIYEFNANFPNRNKQHKYLPRIWATRKIGFLLEEIKLNGEKKELVEEITRLGKKFGIVTPYTSFLITEEEVQVASKKLKNGGDLRDKLAAPAPMLYKPKAMAEESGKDAVTISQSNQQFQQASNAMSNDDLDRIGIQTIRNLDDKTFYLKDGVWQDSEYEEGGSTKRIEYLSSEYFDLIKDNPEINDYIHLSGNMILVFNGINYRIYDE